MTNTARTILRTNTPLRLIETMPQDHDDDSRSTDAAPPLRDTEPPGPGDARAEAFMRDALKSPALPSDFRELAERELVTLYRTAIGMHESLLGTSGLLEQNRRNIVEDISAVVDRGFERMWGRVVPRLDKQDEQIEALRQEVAKLRARVEEQASEITAQAFKLAEQHRWLEETNAVIDRVEKQLRDDAARSQPAAPAEPT